MQLDHFPRRTCPAQSAGSRDDDQGIIGHRCSSANMVPTDSNSIAFSRTTGQVLRFVYLNAKKVTKGGFFPAGVNGTMTTSAAHD